MEISNDNTIAMAPAFSRDNVYFIFRSAREQVEIEVMKRSVIGTHELTSDELKHISLYFPWIDILKYKVIKKQVG